MKLFFWPAKRLMPLYGWLFLGFFVLAAVMSILWHFNAPEWITSTLLGAAFVAFIISGLRAIIVQARDNARNR